MLGKKQYSSVCTVKGQSLPPRLIHRGHLPWLHTYTTQLQAEGKSVNTQKSYMIGLRHLIETPLPGEDIITEFERDSMSVEQLLERIEPFNGIRHLGQLYDR